MSVSYTDAVKANNVAGGRERGAYAEGFSDFLTMKVIGAKRLDMFGTAYGANSIPMTLGQRKEAVRSLGVRIDAICLAELESLIEMLGCSKQEFVLEVLSAGIEQGKDALKSAGLLAAYEVKVNRRVREAGFTSVPAPTKGFYHTHYNGELAVNKEYDAHQAAVGAMSEIVDSATSEGSNN